jgi:outer membrane protein OmpA-like peptidoglycan-associated protein
MNKRFLLGAGVALVAALSWTGAQAQTAMPSAWYFGPEGGWTHLNGDSFSGGGVGGSASFSEGFNAGFRGGYMWGPWRFEAEGTYRRNGNSSVSLSTPVVGVAASNGNRNSIAGMFNVLYDFETGWGFTPHVGAGVGAASVNWGVASTVPKIGLHGTTTEFAYQGIAGVRWMVNPSLAFDVDYRYFATLDPSFNLDTGGTVKTSNSTHNVVASLTMLFGAPPPPPPAPAPPAPPPAMAKVFIVFFDWDKDTITPEGLAIIQQAAEAYKAGGSVTIQVTGYTDRSGSAGYNQRLSERRANNVAKALVRMGVPQTAMSVSGRGENDNRVPTADGVREPQNRRVEIVFP